MKHQAADIIAAFLREAKEVSKLMKMAKIFRLKGADRVQRKR
jgi:hypothetical protein